MWRMRIQEEERQRERERERPIDKGIQFMPHLPHRVGSKRHLTHVSHDGKINTQKCIISLNACQYCMPSSHKLCNRLFEPTTAAISRNSHWAANRTSDIHQSLVSWASSNKLNFQERARCELLDLHDFHSSKRFVQ